MEISTLHHKVCDIAIYITVQQFKYRYVRIKRVELE